MTNTVSIEDAEVIVSPVENNVEINVCENTLEISIGETGPQGPRGTQVLSGPTDPSPIIGLLGDQYINTTTGFLFGPKTESGWGEGVLLGSGLKISDVSFAHYQTIASNVWEITHDLEFTPNIVVVDLTGSVIEADVEYQGQTIILTFSQSITGAAYLS